MGNFSVSRNLCCRQRLDHSCDDTYGKTGHESRRSHRRLSFDGCGGAVLHCMDSIDSHRGRGYHHHPDYYRNRQLVHNGVCPAGEEESLYRLAWRFGTVGGSGIFFCLCLPFFWSFTDRVCRLSGVLMLCSGEKLMIKSFGAIATMYTLPTLLFRASLSGAIVTLAVLMAKIGGPLIGGMFAAFPAVFLSAAIITYWAHGKEFSGAVMKVLMISGALNVMVYAVGIRYLVVPYGILYGTLFSYIISALFAAIPYLSVVKRRVWGLFEEFCAPAYRQRHPAFGWLPVSVQWAGRTAH